jgi:hypothetical protein
VKLAGILALSAAAIGLATFSQALKAQPNPDEIFLDADTDSFDPGLPIGAQFPRIRAIYQGREIDDIDEFFGDRGLAFFALRSVDW